MTRQQSKQERRREEQRRREQERLHTARRKRIVIGSMIGGVATVAAVVLFFVLSHPAVSPGQAPSGQSASTQPGAPVDNISCEAQEQALQHIHAHLVLYINGTQTQLPANVGISSSQQCLYWLHTHATTGVIHVEAPNHNTFTLGSFFDIWGSQFPQLQYPVELNGTTDWKVYVNGQLYNGNFRNIPLKDHESITLAFNSPNVVPEKSFDWSTWKGL